MAFKTYVLLDTLNVDTPAFQQLPNNQRTQITKIPWHRPLLRLQVRKISDKNDPEAGVVRMLRYKSTSKYLFEDEQMEKEKIDANAKFTDQEREDPYFRFGVLTTDKEQLQKFLETHPEFVGSPYVADSVRNKCYKLLDEKAESAIKNADLRRRVKAAALIMSLEVEAAQAMIIRLNGAPVETPKDIEGCQNWLMQFLDDTNDAGIDAIMLEEKQIPIEDKTIILVGKLINAEIISFDAITGNVAKKDKSDKWQILKEVAAGNTFEERQQLFSHFLNTDEGKELRASLEKDLKSYEKKQSTS